MADSKALVWDAEGEKYYETGVKKGVLYVKDKAANGTDGTVGKNGYKFGVAWNGLTGVTESPSGADITKLYANDGVYANLQAAEEFGGTIEAYTYPDEFKVCDGSAVPVKGMNVGQQNRKGFGLSYVTTVGNDEENLNFGYKIHIVYGCLANPSEKAYQTINESPEAITFSWEFSTTPVSCGGLKDADGNALKATSIITIDSKDYADEDGKAKLKALEDVLYGTETAAPYLPMPEEVFNILSGTAA